MRIHASCVARRDASGAAHGVLLRGPPGGGKSDLALRLIDLGFLLVADDRVEIVNGVARAPDELKGLLEVRGLGILEMPHLAAPLRLAVDLGDEERMPLPSCDALGLPAIRLDPRPASAARKVALALDCALGRLACRAGAFEAAA